MAHASEAGHFYYRDGRPCYTVPAKKGGYRPAHVGDAKKLGLVVGTTTPLALEAKPNLTNWMIDQALLSAMTLPRLPGETDDQFIIRAKDDSKQQAIKAALRGTQGHGAIQHYFETWQMDFAFAEEIMAVKDLITQRWGIEGWIAEFPFAHPLGYGGKVDLHQPVIPVVVDVKFKEFTPEKTGIDLAYPEHVAQLAAYGDGLCLGDFGAANIFVNRIPKQPEESKESYRKRLVRVREWDDDEIEKGRKRFRLLLDLWKLNKDWDPAFDPTMEAA